MWVNVSISGGWIADPPVFQMMFRPLKSWGCLSMSIIDFSVCACVTATILANTMGTEHWTSGFKRMSCSSVTDACPLWISTKGELIFGQKNLVLIHCSYCKGLIFKGTAWADMRLWYNPSSFPLLSFGGKAEHYFPITAALQSSSPQWMGVSTGSFCQDSLDTVTIPHFSPSPGT